jgi:peptidoglycan/LPS O-acetylase OafA/YrhL
MKYRAEIDGLRAMAVLPVILFHAGFDRFSGGFVGVDVFFVISGYLIATIIISEVSDGNFSIVNFYERRARRILPALFFVMAACVPFSWLWLTPKELKDFGQSLVAVSTFSSNILFFLETSYFDTAAELKPLLHTWSLAVEEQYYIIFPVFLMVVWRLGLQWIIFLLVIASLVSLGIATWGTLHTDYPKIVSAAFFLLPTRVWELFIGVFIALYLMRSAIPKSYLWSQILSLLGLGMILYSILYFNQTTPFPGLYALIPTIGTALVIIYAVPNTLVHKLCTQKIFVGLGLVSYSAYLWHQPILAFARHRSLGELPDLVLVILCCMSLVLAWFSWKFVEAPFRNKDTYGRRQIFVLSLSGIVVFSGLGLFLHLSDGFQESRHGVIYDRLVRVGLGNYELDNIKLAKNSSQLLDEWHKSQITRLSIAKTEGESEVYIDNKRALLVGNSHSKDLWNVFYHSSELRQSMEAERYAVNLRDIGDDFYDSNSYKAASYIFFVSKYSEEDLDSLYDLTSRILFDNKNLFIVEEIFNFPTFGSLPLSDFVVFSGLKDDASSFSELVDEVNFRHTESFLNNFASQDFYARKAIFDSQVARIHRDFPQVVILSRNDYLCPNDYCYGITPNGEKTFYDGHHHSLEGAKYFGERLSKTKFYNDLLAGIERGN